MLKTFGWLFASLSFLALLSPPGSSHDEWFHIGTIWCGHGNRYPYCGVGFEDGMLDIRAYVDISAEHCTVEARTPCPPLRQGLSEIQLQPGQYPPLFHFVLSWFVLPPVAESVVLMRVVSALIISLLIALTTWLLPPRHRLVLLMIFLTVLTSQGYVLLASINPSSWLVAGMTVGWLALHAALSPGETTARHRVALASVSLLGWFVAIGSRWDGSGFIGLSAILVLAHLAWLKFPSHRRVLVVGSVLVSLAVAALIRTFTWVNPFSLFQRIFSYTDGEPNNVAFLTQHLLRGLPEALGTLGTTPTYPTIILPGFIFPIALVLLGYLMLQTYNRRDPLQLVGFVLISIAISLMFMAWHAYRNEREAIQLHSRYSLPLLVLAVGWWFLQGPPDLYGHISRQIRGASITATVLFALTTFTFAERNVDRQTLGLRYLPEGLDQWWWTWMPVGPNVVVVLAIISFWMFLQSFFSELNRASSETASV